MAKKQTVEIDKQAFEGIGHHLENISNDIKRLLEMVGYLYREDVDMKSILGKRPN